MSAPIFLSELSGRFTFRRRAVPIPADLRPNWRLPLIVFLLRKCAYGQKASLNKIHVLSWSARNEDTRSGLTGVLDGHEYAPNVLVRFEPALNRAIKLLIAEGLVSVVGKDRFGLTAKGSRFAEAVEKLPDCLTQEKEFAELVGKRLTEQLTKAILGVTSAQ